MSSHEELREQLAAIEHERWADWQRWVHARGGKDPRSGALTIPASIVERWERQIETPYDQLSEDEKDEDRRQVDRYWPLIVKLLGEPLS